MCFYAILLPTVLNALDVRGMRFGAELQLYRSLSRWQDYALDIQAKAKVAPSTAIRATPSPLIPATHAYTTLRRLARHIFLPILSQSRLYAHFTDLLPGINNWLSGIPSKLATVAIDGLSPFEACKQAVLDFYDLCHGSCAGSSLGSKRKNSERRAKNSKNGRFNKSSASSRTTTAQLSPLAFAFLEHGKTHRPIDVKSVDKSLSQWRQFVSDCDNAERLYFAVRLLYDHVCAETEDNGAYEERPGVDPLAVVEESSSSEEDVDVAKRTLREAGSTRPLRRNKRLKK